MKYKWLAEASTSISLSGTPTAIVFEVVWWEVDLKLARHAGGVVLTILGKCILISLVVWLFNFPVRTSLAVGLSMAQIGEFAFVLLSVASNLGLLPYQVYMLLMGEHLVLTAQQSRQQALAHLGVSSAVLLVFLRIVPQGDCQRQLCAGITALSLLLTPFLLQASSHILRDQNELNSGQTVSYSPVPA